MSSGMLNSTIIITIIINVAQPTGPLHHSNSKAMADGTLPEFQW